MRREMESAIILWILLEVSEVSQFVSRSYPNSVKLGADGHASRANNAPCPENPALDRSHSNFKISIGSESFVQL